MDLTCPLCRKFFKTTGQHNGRCTRRLTREPFQVVRYHGNDVDSTISNSEAIENLIVNINNQYQLEVPEGTLTEHEICL